MSSSTSHPPDSSDGLSNAEYGGIVVAILVVVVLIVIIAVHCSLKMYRRRVMLRAQRNQPRTRQDVTEEYWTTISTKKNAINTIHGSAYVTQPTQESSYCLDFLSDSQIEENIIAYLNFARKELYFTPVAHEERFIKEIEAYQECERKDAIRLKPSITRFPEYRLKESTRIRLKDVPWDKCYLNANVAGRRNWMILAEEPLNPTIARTYAVALNYNVSVMLVAGEMDPRCAWVPNEPPIFVKKDKYLEVKVTNEQRGAAPELGILRTKLMIRSDKYPSPLFVNFIEFARLKDYVRLLQDGYMDEELITPMAIALNDVMPLPQGQKLMILSRDGAKLASILAIALDIVEGAMEGSRPAPLEIARNLRIARNGAFIRHGLVFGVFLALKMLLLRLKEPPPKIVKFVDDYEQELALVLGGTTVKYEARKRERMSATVTAPPLKPEATQDSDSFWQTDAAPSTSTLDLAPEFTAPALSKSLAPQTTQRTPTGTGTTDVELTNSKLSKNLKLRRDATMTIDGAMSIEPMTKTHGGTAGSSSRLTTTLAPISDDAPPLAEIHSKVKPVVSESRLSL